MIALWKVKRELRRIKLQIEVVYDRCVTKARGQRHDARRPQNLRVTQGQLAPGAQMAVFLLYQPKGFSAALRIAIDAVLENQLIPIFVSNLPLYAADRAYLTTKAWRIVERPNLGYDFGGYREGIMQISEAGLAPERLWILNDSAWFPISSTSAPLIDLIDPTADVSGAMLHMDRRAHKTDYIESYCLSFRKTALDHPAFLTFWQTYPLYQKKQNVIRRGEMALSRVLREAGLRVASRMNNVAFLAKLGDQPPAFLEKTLRYGGLTTEALQRDRADLLQQADGSMVWRDKALAHVSETLSYTGFRYQYCYAAVHLMAFPFLKKGPDARSVVGRARFLDAVDAGDMPPVPEPILHELTAAVAADRAGDRVADGAKTDNGAKADDGGKPAG